MKVSIVIPHNNAADRYDRLLRSVRAALAQDYEDIEVIVKVKLDTTANVAFYGGLDDIDDPRLRCRFTRDASIAHAVNQGMALATGDVLHFACDDDEMLPDACSNAVAALKQHDAEWTYGVMHVVNYDDGQRNILTYIGGWDWDGSRLWQGGNYIPQPTVFWTRKAWDYCGPFDETLPLCFDFEFWARLGSLYTPVVRQHVDSYYEQWEGSISVARQDEQREEVSRAQKRWTDLGFGRRL